MKVVVETTLVPRLREQLGPPNDEQPKDSSTAVHLEFLLSSLTTCSSYCFDVKAANCEKKNRGKELVLLFSVSKRNLITAV